MDATPGGTLIASEGGDLQVCRDVHATDHLCNHNVYQVSHSQRGGRRGEREGVGCGVWCSVATLRAPEGSHFRVTGV